MMTPTPVSLNPPEGRSLLQTDGQNQFFTSPNSQDPRAFFDLNAELRDQNDQQDYKLVYNEGSSSNHQFLNSPQPVMHDPRTPRGPNYVSYSRMGEGESSKSGHGSEKWMSSKMRLMKKMRRASISSSATPKAISSTTPNPNGRGSNRRRIYCQRSPRNNNNTTTRVCSGCETTTTPLWRSGPLGPKSLCNACGIRLRKAKRAMEIENGLSMKATSTKTRVHNKEKKPRTNNFKNKKYKYTTDSSACSPSPSSSSPSESTEESSVKNNSEYEQMFPWDEGMFQAALHLMYMSCANMVN